MTRKILQKYLRYDINIKNSQLEFLAAMVTNRLRRAVGVLRITHSISHFLWDGVGLDWIELRITSYIDTDKL